MDTMIISMSDLLPNDLVLLIYKELHRPLVLASFKELFNILFWHDTDNHYYQCPPDADADAAYLLELYDDGLFAYNFREYTNGTWNDKFGIFNVMHNGRIVWNGPMCKIPEKY